MDTNRADHFHLSETGLRDDVEMVRSELQRTQATLTKSISETVAAVDNLEAKHNTFESQLDGNLYLIQSKLEKLSRGQVQQVSKDTTILNIILIYF